MLERRYISCKKKGLQKKVTYPHFSGLRVNRQVKSRSCGTRQSRKSCYKSTKVNAGNKIEDTCIPGKCLDQASLQVCVAQKFGIHKCLIIGWLQLFLPKGPFERRFQLRNPDRKFARWDEFQCFSIAEQSSLANKGSPFKGADGAFVD